MKIVKPPTEMIGGFYFPSQEVRQRTSGITFQVARLVLHLPLEIEKNAGGPWVRQDKLLSWSKIMT